MDKEKIIKRNPEKKIVRLSICITESMSQWLKEKNFSPTGIFVEACKGLGFKEEKKE